MPDIETSWEILYSKGFLVYYFYFCTTLYIFGNFQQLPLPPVEYLACIYVFKHIFFCF